MSAEEMLNIAKGNLAGNFAVVGLTEEFDRSLILMKRTLGWGTPFYTRQNVGQRHLRKEEIPLETLRVLQENNRLDVELYRYAEELFREQLRAQARSFENELQRFKRLNGAYGRLHRLLAFAKGKRAAKTPGAAPVHET
jgi:hypothetical protein